MFYKITNITLVFQQYLIFQNIFRYRIFVLFFSVICLLLNIFFIKIGEITEKITKIKIILISFSIAKSLY